MSHSAIHAFRLQMLADREAQFSTPSAFFDREAHKGQLPTGIGRHRDSDPIDEANFEAAMAELEQAGIKPFVASYGHWAVGWVESLFVPGTIKAAAIVRSIRSRLENYPILDEDLCAEKEEEQGGRCSYCGGLGHHGCDECKGDLCHFELLEGSELAGDVTCYYCGEAKGEHKTTCHNCGRTVEARELEGDSGYCDYCFPSPFADGEIAAPEGRKEE